MMTQYVHQPAFMTGDEFSIETFSLLNPDGELYPGGEEPALTRDHARRLYQAMLATRILDEASASLVEPTDVRFVQLPLGSSLFGLTIQHVD